MGNSWIIGGALNSGKGMIPRMLKSMSLEGGIDDVNPNVVISLSDISSAEGIFDSISYTDDMRFQYYQTLSDDDKKTLFPKFHLAKMYRKTVGEIMKELGGPEGWNKTELYEADLLFNNMILAYLRSLNLGQSTLTIGIGNTPEGVSRFLDESSNPDVFNTLFVVKTNVDDILERLNGDKDDPNHSKSWPLRLPDNELYKAAKLISLNWLSVAEKADKLGFRIVDTSKDSDEKLLAVAKEIFKKQRKV